MGQDDIEYVLEILDEAIDNHDWELIDEAQQYIRDFCHKKGSKCYEE